MVALDFWRYSDEERRWLRIDSRRETPEPHHLVGTFYLLDTWVWRDLLTLTQLLGTSGYIDYVDLRYGKRYPK